MASTRADRTDVADLAVDLAPSDPQTHYAAAVLYDRTFLADDQFRSLQEYETALALSPHNYLLWIEYGKALSRAGDVERAVMALRRARELAPNYASVAWALGNTLVRQGNEAEGFSEIGRAVESDAGYAAPAMAFEYQYFNGEIDRLRPLAESSPAAAAALTGLLAKDKRLDDAAAVWKTIERPAETDVVAAAGRSLVAELAAAKRYRLAFEVDRALTDRASAPGEVRDGGFESGIKLEKAGVFDWQFSAGVQPQPLQSTAQPHGGNMSLVLRFGSNDGSSLRELSQVVTVSAGSRYTLRGFYRSDLKTSSQLVWQVDTGGQTVEIPLAASAADWTEFNGTFIAPAGSDGAEIRLKVKSCGSSICPINGSLWLDDIALVKAE